MKNTMKTILTAIFALSLSMAYAQKGTVRGQIIDDETGQTIIGASVMIPGTSNGTRTDLDGKYAIQLNPGKHTLTYSFISYTQQEITDINVEAGKVTVLNIRMKKKSQQIKKVVVKAQRISNSETALLTMQRKSANVMDGTSSETFKKTGDNDAATAIARVTGVSVEGGKYVYVRGLGDRYTKSQLNGVDIPGLDPDRNTVQMDIFPTNLLNNIVVYKSFTPDLPGDFTGGMVNIETKSFVERKTIGFSASLGYTPGMNLNPLGLTYESSAADLFAFGNSSRKLPIANVNRIPRRSDNNPALTELTKRFNPQLAPTNFTAPLDGSIAFSSGNQYQKKKYTIGYNTAVNYRSQFRHFDNYELGRAIKSGNKDNTELNQLMTSSGKRSEQEVSWSALAGGALKTQKSKYTLNLVHSQNTVSRAAIYDTRFPDGQNTALPLKQYVLDYSQRSVTNALVAGSHSIKNDKWRLDWKLSPTYSNILEPDVRSTTYLIENGEYVVDNGDGAIPERYYRSLHEVNGVAKIDLSTKFNIWNGEESKLSFGAANTIKNRDYQILRFIFNNTMGANWTGNGNEMLLDENIWSPTNPSGTYVQAEESLTMNPNIYNASQNVFAAYVMNELPITDKLKAIYGARLEKTDMWISGYGRFAGEQMDEQKTNEKVMDAADILPSVNLIYALTKKQNLRASYSRTLARPSFKEKSFVSILDPLSNVRFIGNIDLKRTNIDNIDLRWENYITPSEIISVSGFYKRFQNPIEIAGFLLQPNDITPRNAGLAHLMGLELEIRKELGFISKKLDKFSFTTNVTLVRSLIDMREIVVAAGQDNRFGTADDVTEFQSRTNNLRNGETLSHYRSMFGQSPYIINAGLNYTNDTLGFETQLTYNVQGKRLAVVGVGEIPDVYDREFHSLNLKLAQRFGKGKQWQGSLTVTNMLNDRRERLYESFNANPQVFEAWNPGRRFSLGISYLMQ